MPGILLIDEMQRFKTVDETGADIQSDVYQDLWMLLSDGKFSANASVFKDIEGLIAQQLYSQDQLDPVEKKTTKKKKVKSFKNEGTTAVLEEVDAESSGDAKKRFRIYPYEAQSLKKLLRLTETVTEIMEWSLDKVMTVVSDIQDNRKDWTIDYTKLLVFISGNLDAAYTGSVSVEDCDTDADFYHEITKKITVSDIKTVLTRKFRPEQISRFGNNHIIYPSLSKDSYKRLIKRTCTQYLDNMQELTGIEFTISQNAMDVIYENSVYPTQGTRPVFSAIHQIFSNPLISATMWAVENQYEEVSLDINEVRQKLVAKHSTSDATADFDTDLEISTRKAKASSAFKTYIAVHEAGHAVVSAYLTGVAPLEVKINSASFKGGYVLTDSTDEIVTKKMLEDRICVSLAGAAAEELFFGKENMSTGAESDRRNATSGAMSYIREHGFSELFATVIPPTFTGADNSNTDLEKTNVLAERLIQNQYERAKRIIQDNGAFFVKIVDTLQVSPVIAKDEFIEMASPYMKLAKTREGNFDELWENAKARFSESFPVVFEENPRLVITAQ